MTVEADKCFHCSGILEEGEGDICNRCLEEMEDCVVCQKVLEWSRKAIRQSIPIDLQQSFGEGVNHARYIIYSMITGEKYDPYMGVYPEIK